VTGFYTFYEAVNFGRIHMSGFFSGHDFAPNRIDLEFRKAENKKGFINLAGSNPTYEGIPA
jgi:hypothetical protein